MPAIFLLMGWLPALFALAALAGSYVFARRRAFYQPRDPSNERTDRIWHSASFFAAAAVAPMAVALLIVGLPAAMLFFLITALVVGMVGLVLIVAIDLVVVKPLEAKRTKGWMIAAPAIFAFVFLGFLLIPFIAWAGWDPAALLRFGSLSLLGDAAAAGLVWWAYLPIDAADIRRPFE